MSKTYDFTNFNNLFLTIKQKCKTKQQKNKEDN
jgi:hypothetical protein